MPLPTGFFFPEMNQIPQDLVNSMTIASVSFLLAIWLIVFLSTKNLKNSLIILGGMLLWYAVVYFPGIQGFWAQNPFFAPFIAFGFITLVFWIKFLYSSAWIRRIADSIPVSWLVLVQVFRVMGIGFLSFHALGLIPGEFAIPTGWGDVFVGLAAIPVAFFLWQKARFAKNLAIWWNYIGIGDLALALIMGNLTFPRPVQMLTTQPDNLLIAMYPLVMVPLFAVPLSLLLHFLTLRALRK